MHSVFSTTETKVVAVQARKAGDLKGALHLPLGDLEYCLEGRGKRGLESDKGIAGGVNEESPCEGSRDL